MILESTIEHVIALQKHRLSIKDPGLQRELVPATKSLSSHALVISGVRRCEKSTLLLQMLKSMDNAIMFLHTL